MLWSCRALGLELGRTRVLGAPKFSFSVLGLVLTGAGPTLTLGGSLLSDPCAAAEPCISQSVAARTKPKIPGLPGETVIGQNLCHRRAGRRDFPHSKECHTATNQQRNKRYECQG